MIRAFRKAWPIMAAIQFVIFAAAFGVDPVQAQTSESPFVICNKQRYALCAAADCFVYDGVAYCKCDVKNGDSISLQLSYTGSTQNVCQVNQQGRRNGYMISTYSLPAGVQKGGSSAIYTCPGTGDLGSGGAVAPVAYGQCDGGFCFESSRGQRIPGFAKPLKDREIICSCPVSTEATAGSSDPLGYQIFGAYHPTAALGSRCDANSCAACSVPNPTANGAAIMVGAPAGSPDFLTQQLDGSVPPLNRCLCTCTTVSGVTTCSVGEDQTP